MRSTRRDNQFKRDVKRVARKGKDLDKLKTVINLLAEAQRPSREMKDHPLKGPLKDCRELHLEPDWFLIYRVEGNELCLVRTGNHQDLFG